MQFILDMDDGSERLRRIDTRLRVHFADFRPRYLLLPPVSQLVMSLLGGQTYSHISRAAHFRLMERYGGWADVRDARVSDVASVIRGVNHYERKAAHIQGALTAFTGHQAQPSLGWLEPLSVEEGHMRLEAVTGIGPKIAAAVLNTSTLRKRSLVIDSHHKRILVRLGLLDHGSDFVKAYRHIMPLVPQDWSAEAIDIHHILFKRLGQTHCRPAIVHCDACPLRPLCPTGRGDRPFHPIYS